MIGQIILLKNPTMVTIMISKCLHPGAIITPSTTTTITRTTISTATALIPTRIQITNNCGKNSMIWNFTTIPNCTPSWKDLQDPIQVDQREIMRTISPNWPPLPSWASYDWAPLCHLPLISHSKRLLSPNPALNTKYSVFWLANSLLHTTQEKLIFPYLSVDTGKSLRPK